MEFGRFFCLFFLVCLFSATEGYRFSVGGRNGWVVKPSESYDHWAERNRFQVNDTLYFKYQKGSDSVLVVDRDDFSKCNTSKPIKKLDDGESEFKLDRSGPFYFISGQDGNCEKGQKLILIVLAVRHRQQKSPPASSPQAHPPTAAPPEASSPAPANPPAPAAAPSGSSPSPSPSSSSPSPSSSSSPVAPPTLSPPSTSPFSSPPSPVAPAPTSQAVPPVAAPGTNQDSTAPTTPGKNGAYGVTASGVFVSSVIVLVSLGLMSSSFF